MEESAKIIDAAEILEVKKAKKIRAGLTDIKIRTARPREKRYQIYDTDGLYCEVMTTGAKKWRVRFQIDGQDARKSLGDFPAIGLAEARKRRDEFKLALKRGEDPRKPQAPAKTFGDVAREWMARKVEGVKTPGHVRTIYLRMNKYIFPAFGERPIKEITPPEILPALRRIEEQGFHETASRIRGIMGQIFRFGIAIGECERDPAADLRDALTPVPEKHFASITRPDDITNLLRAMSFYQGTPQVKALLSLIAYTFLRSSEARLLEWDNIDFDATEIHIPADRMKKRRPHIVPMAQQVVELLEGMKPHSGRGRFVFPSPRTPNGDKALSDAAALAAIRSLGFTKEQMTVHGFRSMASTILHEQGWPSDAIERQLAHVEGNSVKAAYNYAEYLDERRRMMQAWADWLDNLKA